jgi:hypothetical protein
MISTCVNLDLPRNIVGTTRPAEGIENSHLDELRGSLLKLPRVHLMVLDAVVAHLKQ